MATGKAEARRWLDWMIPLPKEVTIRRTLRLPAGQIGLDCRAGLAPEVLTVVKLLEPLALGAGSEGAPSSSAWRSTTSPGPACVARWARGWRPCPTRNKPTPACPCRAGGGCCWWRMRRAGCSTPRAPTCSCCARLPSSRRRPCWRSPWPGSWTGPISRSAASGAATWPRTSAGRRNGS